MRQPLLVRGQLLFSECSKRYYNRSSLLSNTSIAGIKFRHENHKSKYTIAALIFLIVPASVGATPASDSVCYGTTSKGWIKNSCKLPLGGDNFKAYSLLGQSSEELMSTAKSGKCSFLLSRQVWIQHEDRRP